MPGYQLLFSVIHYKNMARPKLDIDAEQVERLAEIGTPTVDIAFVFKCSVDTIENRFREQLQTGRANQRIRLRRKQMDMALSGNVPLLIWLGKQVLGQSEKQEIKTESNTDSTLQLNWGSHAELTDLARQYDGQTD